MIRPLLCIEKLLIYVKLLTFYYCIVYFKIFFLILDFVSFFLNQNVYDADSEDEEWLRSKENININYFEEIMLKLEMASQSADAIIQPMEAKILLDRYNSQIIDDVYDYWLQKRKVFKFVIWRIRRYFLLAYN